MIDHNQIKIDEENKKLIKRIKLKKDVKEKWLKALRSGNYKQGEINLNNNNNTFCCLGVLCDIYIKENNLIWNDNAGSTGVKSIYTSAHTLPKIIIMWAYDDESFNLEDTIDKSLDYLTGGITLINDKPVTLWMLNDNLNKTFDEIADIIEDQM